MWSGDREQEEENIGTKPWSTEIRKPWSPGSGKYWEEPETLHSVKRKPCMEPRKRNTGALEKEKH